MRKVFSGFVLALAVVAALPAVAFAHVVVSPAQAGVGSRTTFSVSVPNEKQVPVTGLRLTIPSELEDVTPTVHAGWTITTAKDGETVTEIRWAGGTIPTGMRDEFSFRAMVPAKETDLIWKAYQTYADGTTSAWDQEPTPDHAEDASSTSGPASVTKVTNDLTASDTGMAATSGVSASSVYWALSFSLISLVLCVALFFRFRKK